MLFLITNQFSITYLIVSHVGKLCEKESAVSCPNVVIINYLCNYKRPPLHRYIAAFLTSNYVQLIDFKSLTLSLWLSLLELKTTKRS